MRLSRFGLVFVLIAGCGSAQEASVSVEGATVKATPTAAEPVALPTENPDADHLGEGSWSPGIADQPEATEAVIDLKTGEGYTSVSVNGAPPREDSKPIKCKTAKDCAGVPRLKIPGDMRCIKSACMFVTRRRTGSPDDVIEVF